MRYRIGIDLGGTKTEIAVLGGQGDILLRRRTATPRAYADAIATIAGLVEAVEAELGVQCSVGIGIPGSISPATGLVRNANSNALNGHAFDRDMGARLQREVRVANDADCFALSEATDGAAAGIPLVFGVILGTGCGGGIVFNGQVLTGRNGIAAEWGHTALPRPRPEEMPLRKCWCGQDGCLERYLSGPALACEADGPGSQDASGLPARAAAGDPAAIRALASHADYFARGLAMITNIIDPDIIVLGGGLSNLAHLYTDVPELMKRYVFSDVFTTRIVANVHGDSSGVRGAAWLWPG